MLVLLAPSLSSPERIRPERLRRMCPQALISDREESAWAARRGRPEREITKERRLADTSASLLGLAEGPGKQQFEPFSGQIPVDPRLHWRRDHSLKEPVGSFSPLSERGSQPATP